MTWKEVQEHLRQGAQLVFTNDIPGGWCFALRLRNSPGQKKLIRLQRARCDSGTVNAILYTYRVLSLMRRTPEGNRTWKEVQEHLRQGAQLVFTNEIPGGWCFALRHALNNSAGRSKLIRVRRLPPWVGIPNPLDHRPVLAALEMSIAGQID